MDDKNPNRDDIKPDKTAGRRKRIAPTIDLEAQEIPPSDIGASEPLMEAAEPKREETIEATAPSEEPAQAPERANATRPLVIGAASGALAAACIVAIAWSAGTFSGNTTASSDPRIAALEAQLKDLQSRPAAIPNNQVSNESGKSDALMPRIAKVEDQVAKLSSAPSSDSALASLGVALTALNKRYDELAATTRDAQARAAAAEQAAAELRRSLQDVSKTAQGGPSSADVTSLQTRLTALEDQSKTARADLARARESDKAARLALSATAVRDAALRGVPFAEELAQAKALGASEAALAPLWPFAASGVPAVKALSKELSDLLPSMRKAVAPAPVAAGGFLERLQANAEGLVRVRPAGAPASDDGSAALTRLEADLSRDDIAAALTTVSALPQTARQLAADWVTRAMARQKALAAARDLAADTSRSLGSR